MKIVDRQNPRKLYLQLVEIIQDAIESGELAIGIQLPTEDMLCTQQGVSKSVIRTALQELSRLGLVRKIPGKGTFVQKPSQTQGVWLYTKLTEDLLDFGVSWKTEVAQKMLSVAPTDLAKLFSQESGHQVLKVSRIRSIEDTPAVLETAYVSNDLCPGLQIEDLRTCSILDLLSAKFKIPIIRCADSVEVTVLEKREAELLKREAGKTALLLDRIFYTTNNRVVAFVRLINVSEHHRVTFESFRTPGE